MVASVFVASVESNWFDVFFLGYLFPCFLFLNAFEFFRNDIVVVPAGATAIAADNVEPVVVVMDCFLSIPFVFDWFGISSSSVY